MEVKVSGPRRIIKLHQTTSEGGACVHCGSPQPWAQEMDPCCGSFYTNVAGLSEALARLTVEMAALEELTLRRAANEARVYREAIAIECQSDASKFAAAEEIELSILALAKI